MEGVCLFDVFATSSFCLVLVSRGLVSPTVRSLLREGAFGAGIVKVSYLKLSSAVSLALDPPVLKTNKHRFQ